ncbi:MAG: cell surface protein, partial [Proteiniphilum sp.]|nr:cell surface protein [Proteiniphilum sp.]
AGADLDALSDKIDDIDATLNVLNFASINNMITEISFDYEGDDVWNRDRTLNFSTAPAKLSWTFGQGFPGAIQFVKDQRLLATESTIEVKVSPSNADVSKMLDKIYLIRRDGNNEVNTFLKAVKAERSTALRAAPSVTGLWNITFQMPADADISDLSDLVEDNLNVPYLFQIAIENTIDEAEDAEARYVHSDFGIEIAAGTVNPIYNDDDSPNVAFTVDNTSYAIIKNRYLLSETGTTTPADQKWNGGSWNTTATPTVADPTDDRRAQPFFAAEVGKTFTVELDNPDDVFAYYVVLDKDWALESAPSEWNAWSAYSYEGLNQVYAADEVANLKVVSTSAVNDIVGFRVMVVNYDGTLVDPDGKSFYVAVGPQSSSWNAVNTVVTALNPNEVVPTATESAEVNVTLSAVTGANSFTWTTDAAQNTVAPAFDVFFVDANDNILFGTDGTGAVTANFANVTKVYTVATVNDWLQYTDNKVYNGTLTINNSLGNVLRTLNVSFKKVLPTGAPAGFSVKTNQIATDGVYYSYLVPDNWTAPLATQGTMPLDQVFNFGSGLLANYQTIFAASAVSGANLVPVTVTGNGTLSVDKSFVDNTTQHATSVVYNYGLISTATPTVDYKVTILGFPTVFSNIYNHTYSWRWATRADLGLAATAALPYSTSIEYGDTQSFDLAHIFGVSTRDSQYNAFLDAPYLASLQVISAKLVSNANGLDEYFDVTPDPLAGATVFTLTQKSGSTNPTADVASTLVLTAKDMYDNDVEIELPMTVTKR